MKKASYLYVGLLVTLAGACLMVYGFVSLLTGAPSVPAGLAVLVGMYAMVRGGKISKGSRVQPHHKVAKQGSKI